MSIAAGAAARVPERTYLFRGGDLVFAAADRAWFEPDRLAALIAACAPDSPGPEPHGAAIERRIYPVNGRVCEALRLDADADLGALAASTYGGAAPDRAAGDADAGAGSEALRALPYRTALSLLSPDEFAESAKGEAFLNWVKVARYCGCCGAPLVDDPAEGFKAGARRCSACGQIFYPHISPAIIVAIIKDKKLLLAHNARFPSGRFGLIAGFVEAGESLEEACRREIREETGMEVRNLRYRCSQTWPFPDSLMLAYVADWESGRACPDGEEISELRWCAGDSLPDIPPRGSVARRLIDEFTGGALE